MRPAHLSKNNKILCCEIFSSEGNCVQICKCRFSKFLSVGVQKSAQSAGFVRLRGNTGQVSHKLREIDVSMVKVVATARRAVAVRCIGCGSNGQLWRGYSCRAQMTMTFNCHGPQGSRRRGKKTRKKRTGLRVAITLSWSTQIHYKDSLIWLLPRCRFHGDEEFVFGDNLRKVIVCFFYRCSWYSVTKTGPRQQRILDVISYIKTHNNSILQVHTFCSTVVYYKHANIHIRAFNYEHGMTDSRIILHIL